MLCQGITGKKVQCQNKVSGQNKYCRYHIHQEPKQINSIKPITKITKPIIINNNSNNKPIIPIISNRPNITNKFIINNNNSNNKPIIPIITNNGNNDDRDCSICLCEVEEKEDCGLICGHLHHVDCIKQLLEAICPVCRAPLQFRKQNTVDSTKIKIRELKEKEERIAQTIEDDRKLALEEDIKYTTELYQQPQRQNREIDMINRIIEESLLSEEMDDYNRIAQAAEENYLYQQSYEEKLLEDVMKQSLSTISMRDSLFHYLDQLFAGKERVIISLNH